LPKLRQTRETYALRGKAESFPFTQKIFRPQYEPSKRRLTWPNGARGTLFNATEPDQLRGPQHSLAWCDELAKWQYAEETWDQLQFGMRLGKHPRQIVATTPRPISVLKRILADPSTVTTRGSTQAAAFQPPQACLPSYFI
jgi:phage terminase large subunit-like protein